MYANLQKLVTTKTLPTKDLCIDERKLNKNLENVLLINDESIIEMARANCNAITNAVFSEIAYRCFCEKDVADGKTSEVCNAEKSQNAAREAEQKLCRSFGAEWNSSSRTCNCATATYDEDKEKCEYRFNGETSQTMGGYKVQAFVGKASKEQNLTGCKDGEYFDFGTNKCVKYGSSYGYKEVEEEAED